MWENAEMGAKLHTDKMPSGGGGGGAGDDDSSISKCQGEEAAATSVEYFAFPYANFNPESSSHDEEFRRGGGRRGRKMFIITVIRGFPPHILD